MHLTVHKYGTRWTRCQISTAYFFFFVKVTVCNMHTAMLPSSHADIVPKTTKGCAELTCSLDKMSMLIYNMYQNAKGNQGTKYT